MTINTNTHAQTDATGGIIQPAVDCCSSAEQAVCCEPADKAACCGEPAPASSGCGCR